MLVLEISDTDDVKGIAFISGINAFSGAELKVLRLMLDEGFAPKLLKRDAGAIGTVVQDLMKKTARWGTNGAVVRAVSLVEMALWDLAGKRAGLPFHRMLGGNNDPVRAYASGGYYTDDERAFAHELESYVDQNFGAVKIKIGIGTLEENIERTRLARQVIGAETELMVDVNEAWNATDTIRYARAVDDCRLFWLEEPLAQSNGRKLSALRQSVSMPIAAGENLYETDRFMDLLMAEAVDFMQPDATRVLGLGGWIAECRRAEAFGVKCVPHAMQEYHVSLSRCVSNCDLVEWFVVDHPNQILHTELFPMEPSGLTIKDGMVSIQSRPGLGLELDAKAAARFEVAL